MTDSGGKLDDITTRIKNVITSVEGNVDVDGLLQRVRETVGKVASDVDTDAVVNRVKGIVGQAEGKVDPTRIRQLTAEVDRERVKSWLAEAQNLGAGAASVIGTQSEKLFERAPGAFDKFGSVAKGKLGSLTGETHLPSEGQIERLKDQMKKTLSTASEVTKSAATNARDAGKPNVDEHTRRD